MKEKIKARDVFRAFNPIGRVVTALAAIFALLLCAAGIRFAYSYHEGYFAQIFDPRYCGRYVVEELPQRQVAAQSGQQGQFVDPESLKVITDASDPLLVGRISVSPILTQYVGVSRPAYYLSCQISRYSLSSFLGEFEVEPAARASCWQKIRLKEGNYYIFLGREAAQEMYDALDADHPEEMFEFGIDAMSDLRLNSPIVQLERDFMRNRTQGRQEVVLSATVGIVAAMFMCATGIACLWTTFVYYPVKRELV